MQEQPTLAGSSSNKGQTSEAKSVDLTPSEKRWASYYEATRSGWKVEPFYDNAIQQLSDTRSDEKLTMLDLGAGAGTVALLAGLAGKKRVSEGSCKIEVTAEDMNRNALAFIKQRAKEAGIRE